MPASWVVGGELVKAGGSSVGRPVTVMVHWWWTTLKPSSMARSMLWLPSWSRVGVHVMRPLGATCMPVGASSKKKS